MAEERGATIYMTGAMPRSSSSRARLQAHPEVGVLLQPESHLEPEIANFANWGVDNGGYALTRKGGSWDADTLDGFFGWIETLPRTARFVAIPDVLNWVEIAGELTAIGDAAATLELFYELAPRVRAMGFRVALVAQDGLEELEVPWEELDAIFVGGSDAWKLGEAAARITQEAKRRGKWVHVGKVNSAKRHQYARRTMGADSADGTFLAFGPDANMRRLMSLPKRPGGRAARWLTPEAELAA